uniref:Uncharacterized protein n=1 Tax=Opuntia streptacantha TaxID=393608 RepID=A0A7C9AV39_OPUST
MALKDLFNHLGSHICSVKTITSRIRALQSPKLGIISKMACYQVLLGVSRDLGPVCLMPLRAVILQPVWMVRISGYKVQSLWEIIKKLKQSGSNSMNLVSTLLWLLFEMEQEISNEFASAEEDLGRIKQKAGGRRIVKGCMRSTMFVALTRHQILDKTREDQRAPFHPYHLTANK